MSTSYVTTPAQSSIGAALSPQAEHEFGDAESKSIARAGGRAALFGVMNFGAGALTVLGGVVRSVNLTTVLVGLFPMLIGASFIVAGGLLRAVRSTQGRDVQNLVRGMNALSRALLVSTLLAAFAGTTTFASSFLKGYRDAAARQAK